MSRVWPNPRGKKMSTRPRGRNWKSCHNPTWSRVPGRPWAGGCSKGRKIMAKLTKPVRDRISATKFAFPKQRKEPLENASHVRNAVARFGR
jgi:hypothetical protein